MIIVRIYLVLLILVGGGNSLGAEEQLLLYFDVNKTLIASDKASDKTVDNVVNHLLAEKYIGVWSPDQNAPYSYVEFIYQTIDSNDLSTKKLKKIRKVFLDNFVEHLSDTDHPLKKEVNENYQKLMSKLNDSTSIIFESFFSLLKYLNETNTKYSIVIRSFGNDIPDVGEAIEKKTSPSFFENSLTFQKGILKKGENEYQSPEEIHDVLASGKNLLIQDDWKWWSEHQYQRNYAKPFYLACKDSDLLEIFFDDNLGDPLSEIDIVAPLNVCNGESLKPNQLIDDGRLVKVDTIEAILDNEYYINKVKKILSYGREKK